MASSCDSPLTSLSSSSPPSSPLSRFSRSPSPPCGYPSPSSTQQSSSRAPSSPREMPSSNAEADGEPPAKKRKLTEPKARTTEYLDLGTFDEGLSSERTLEDQIQLDRLLKALRKKQKIVVIAGAGISVSAGIPDFRSATGLFKTLRSEHKLKASGKHLFDASVYRNDSSTSSFHDMVRELSHLTRTAKPTAFHHMIASLAEEGRLLRLYTQNVDGIDTSLEPLKTAIPLNSKGPWPKTVQLHGSLEKMVCTRCGKLSDFDGALFEGPSPPSCLSCEETDMIRTTMAGKRSHGIGRLRPRMVLYNEFNPDDEAIGAVSHADLRARPDAVIVVGTSLKVPGVRRIAREMCSVARGRKDGFTAWINNGPEPSGVEFKDSWDLVVRGDCDDVARAVHLPHWDDKDIGTYSDVTGQDIGRNTPGIKVEIPLEAKKVLERAQGLMSPMASPRNQSPTPHKFAKASAIKIHLQLKGANAAVGKTSKTAPTKNKTIKKPATGKPLNKITNSFPTSKATKPMQLKQSKPRVQSSSIQVVAPLFPNLTKDKAATEPMRPLSPSEVRNNTDASLFISTPESQLPQYRETISPKAVPSGMKNIID